MRRTICALVVAALMITLIPVSANAKNNVKLTLRAVKASAGSITVKWNNCGAKKYKLERGVGNGNFKTLKTYKKAGKFKDKKLSEKKTYKYRVKAVMGDGSVITSNTCKKVSVKGNYKKGTSWGKYLTKKQRAYVKSQVANIVNCKLNQKKSTFQKVKTINDWMRSRTMYTMEGKNYYNAYGFFKNKRASCYGFASAFKAICDGAGINSRIVYANKNAINPSHAWNMVKVGGKWYVIDTQISIGGIFHEVKYYGSFLIGKKNDNYVAYKYYKNAKKLPKVAKEGWSFKVIFVDGNGKKWVRKVHCGEDAIPPDNPGDIDDDHYFDHWKGKYTNVWKNTTVKAVYKKYEEYDEESMDGISVVITQQDDQIKIGKTTKATITFNLEEVSDKNKNKATITSCSSNVSAIIDECVDGRIVVSITGKSVGEATVDVSAYGEKETIEIKVIE